MSIIDCIMLNSYQLSTHIYIYIYIYIYILFIYAILRHNIFKYTKGIEYLVFVNNMKCKAFLNVTSIYSYV